MRIQKDIFLKHITEATIEQLILEHEQKGYTVVTAGEMLEMGADLVVKKGSETIVYQVKAGEWNQEKRQAVHRTRNRAVHQLGTKFKLVLVNLPEKPQITVEDLEGLFFELLPQRANKEFAEWAPQPWIDKISVLEFEQVSIRHTEVEVKGTGLLTVGLHTNETSEFAQHEEASAHESRPFYFHLILDRELRPTHIYRLELEPLTPEGIHPAV